MKKSLPILLLTVLLLSLIIVSAGCTGEDTAGEIVEAPEMVTDRDTLIIGLGRDFYYGPEDRTFLHGSTNVWESLVYLDDSLKAQPWLAEEFYSSEDGKYWTFKLREGIQFHDGEIMSSATVRDNLLRLSRHPGTAQPYSELVEIRIVDELTIEVELAVPMPAFPEMISYFPSAIFSPQVINDTSEGLTAPIGTGPYMFESYGNDEIKLVAFDQYWAGKPHINQVIFKYIPDENTRVSALQAGEVDALADVGVILPEQVPLLADNQEINLKTVNVLTTIFMHFQVTNSPFDQPALRRAIAMLPDREMLVSTMLDGYGMAAQGVITPLADYWVNPAAAPVHNPDQAGQVIETELNNLEEVIILVNSSWTRRWPLLSLAQYLQTELGRYGVNASVNSLEMGAYNDAVKAGEYHITFTPWTGSDPDDFFRTWILSDGSFNINRGMLYKNNEIDRLIEEAASEMDRAKRQAIYFELQERIAEEAPITPLYHDVTVYAVRSYVKDFEMDFEFRPDLQAVYFE